MINKKSLWFLTLFSLILVLSVYYITMPSELLLTTNGDYVTTSTVSNEETNNQEVSVEIEESEMLVALRVEADEQVENTMNSLKTILTSTDASIEEKNDAFEQMKNLTNNRNEEQNLEKKILEEFKLKSFVKIDGDQIRVVVDSTEHNTELANKIMRSVQSNFETKMYISVKFQISKER